jgi:thiosulfate dehydrogenase [quinone] large subunit
MAGMSTTAVPDAALVDTRLGRGVLAVVRVGVALLWVQNSSWKIPPRFGEGDPPGGLYEFARHSVDYPTFPPFAALMENLVLPNFTFFGWITLLLEASLGAFLLVGLATRFWALVGAGQSVVIALSVANAPDEWIWSYLLMVLVHLVLLATAAGRYGGLDGVLRPVWQRSDSRAARWLVRAS